MNPSADQIHIASDPKLEQHALLLLIVVLFRKLNSAREIFRSSTLQRMLLIYLDSSYSKSNVTRFIISPVTRLFQKLNFARVIFRLTLSSDREHLQWMLLIHLVDNSKEKKRKIVVFIISTCPIEEAFSKIKFRTRECYG